MRNIKKTIASLLACVALLPSQSQADSYYLTNSRPIVSTSRVITQVKASDNIMAWQEREGTTHTLKAMPLETQTATSLASSSIPFESVDVKGSQVAWIHPQQNDGYSIWDPSNSRKKIQTPTTNLKKVLITDMGILYESEDPIQGDNISLLKNDGSHVFFRSKNLAGVNEHGFIIDTSLVEGRASLISVDLTSQERNPVYKSGVTGSYIDRNSYLTTGTISAWVVRERLPAQNTIDSIVTYFDGTMTVPLSRNNTITRLDLSDKGIFFNQLNASKTKWELYTWDPDKGTSLLNEKLPSAYRFAVNSTNVFLSNTNAIYQTTLVEYPASVPQVGFTRNRQNPRTLEFKVNNAVQGKVYVLQEAGNLEGPWVERDRIPTTFTVNSKNAKDAVQFSYTIQGNAPQGFLRVKVDTP